MFSPYEINWISEIVSLAIPGALVAFTFHVKGRFAAVGVLRWFLGFNAILSLLVLPRAVLSLSPDAVTLYGFWLLCGAWLLATRAPKVLSGPQSGSHHEHR